MFTDEVIIETLGIDAKELEELLATYCLDEIEEEVSALIEED